MKTETDRGGFSGLRNDASLSCLVCFATARKRAAQDTREKALARFSRPPTTDEQALDVYFVYKTGCDT